MCPCHTDSITSQHYFASFFYRCQDLFSAPLWFACDWRPAVTATGDWANPSSQKMNNANKPQVRWELPPHAWLGVCFLDTKGKTHGRPDSSKAAANTNRTLPLVSVMCDLLDLIFISSPHRPSYLKVELHRQQSVVLLSSPGKPWLVSGLFSRAFRAFCGKLQESLQRVECQIFWVKSSHYHTSNPIIHCPTFMLIW